jgi:AcrR family transcriptional regulator
MVKKREEERRAQILRAAIETVADLGIEGATMKKVADRAGVSTGMITYYFSDKNDLMKNALAFGHEMVGARRRRLQDSAVVGDRIRGLFEVSLADDYPDVPPLSFWVEYWAHATRDQDLKDFRAGRIARFRQTISQSIQDGIDSGEYLADVDSLLAADLLQALLDGLQLKLTLDSATISPDRAMETVELLLSLLRGRAGRRASSSAAATTARATRSREPEA